MGELLWIVDLNLQSLDRGIPDVQIDRLQGMLAAVGWQVLTAKWGHRLTRLLTEPGEAPRCESVVRRCGTRDHQRLLRTRPEELGARIVAEGGDSRMAEFIGSIETRELASLIRYLGGHDLGLFTEMYERSNRRVRRFFSRTPLKDMDWRRRATRRTIPRNSR